MKILPWDGRNGRALYAEAQAGDEKRVKYNIGDSAEHVEQDGESVPHPLHGRGLQRHWKTR